MSNIVQTETRIPLYGNFAPNLTSEGLEEFKQIILEDYGIELSDQQAYQDAVAFLESFKALATNTILMQKEPIDIQSRGGGNVS